MRTWPHAAAFGFAASLIIIDTAQAGDQVVVIDGSSAAGTGVIGNLNAQQSPDTVTKQGNGTFTLGSGTATSVSGTIKELGEELGTAKPADGVADVNIPSSPLSTLGGQLSVNRRIDNGVSLTAATTLNGNGRYLDNLTATGTIGTINITGKYLAGSTYRLDVDAVAPSKRFSLGGGVKVLKQPGSTSSETTLSAAGMASTQGVGLTAPLTAWVGAMAALGPATGDGAGSAAAGISYKVAPQVTLGLAAGYAASDQRADVGSGEWMEQRSLAAYGSYTRSTFEADAIAGYGTFSSQVMQHITFPGLTPRLTDGAIAQTDTTALGVQARSRLTDSAQAYVRYSGEFGGLTDSHALTAGFRVTW